MKHLREQARKSAEAKVKAHGGNVHGSHVHSDAAEDKSMIKRMVKPEALTGRAHGGKSPSKGGHKPGTKVNVIVAPHVGNRPVPVPVPVQGGSAGSVGVAPSRPVVRPAAPAGLAGLAGPAPAPNAPLKCGGKAHRAHGGRVGHFEAGAGSGEGRLEKTEHEKRRRK
jgi:hypothetical protein